MSEKQNSTAAQPLPFIIGQTVYHRRIYNHREPLKIVGITETELELEGDFSGGTHNVCQKDWLPIKGTSRVYNHAFKAKCRSEAISVNALAIPIADSTDNLVKTMLDLADMVIQLTTDVAYNPEY